jgi:hypothetical protein
MPQQRTARRELQGRGSTLAVQPGRRSVSVLTLVIAVLSSVAALAGVLTAGGPGTHEVSSLRGAPVTLYGEGLFAFDTWLLGVGNRGQDLIVLLVEIPLLLAALAAYRRGWLRGQVALAGVLSFFLYYYASMTFATAQNWVFPLYVAVFAAALFAFVRVFSSIDADQVSSRFPRRHARPRPRRHRPRRRPGRGAATAPHPAWPRADSDRAGAERGHRAGAHGAGQGAAQLLAGVPMTPGEILSKMLTFAALTVVAGAVLSVMVRARRPDGVGEAAHSS